MVHDNFEETELFTTLDHAKLIPEKLFIWIKLRIWVFWVSFHELRWNFAIKHWAEASWKASALASYFKIDNESVMSADSPRSLLQTSFNFHPVLPLQNDKTKLKLMPLGHLLHDNYQTRQFNIRSGQYAIISEKDIPPFGSVSVVSKVLLPHRNNIPKPRLSTWKLVSPVVRKSILKLAFEVKHPKKIMKMCMHQNFSNSFLVARLKCMLIGGHKDIFSSISVI